jgi:hypothetical protein
LKFRGKKKDKIYTKDKGISLPEYAYIRAGMSECKKPWQQKGFCFFCPSKERRK